MKLLLLLSLLGIIVRVSGWMMRTITTSWKTNNRSLKIVSSFGRQWKPSYGNSPIISLSVRAYNTNIYLVGKKLNKDDWVSIGCDEYEKRLTPIMAITTHYLKSDEELLKKVDNFALKGKVFALDERGSLYDSHKFTDVLYKGYEEGGSTVHFIVGGFAGLPKEIRNRFPLISLSKMTWTHQMARLLLIEQIYRATEIRKGSSYHKD